MNVVGSGCYRSFIGAAPTPLSFKRIHSAFLALAPLSALTPEFCASKVIFSDLASKKRPVWTAQMPVLDWLFL